MHFSRILILLTATTALFGAVGKDTFHWSGKVPPGQQIEIRGVNGSIHAEPSLGNDVDVVAFKNGVRYDAADIEVRVVEHDGGVTICAVYPSVEGRGNECLPIDGGHATSPISDVSVDFTVRVPKGVRFIARTVNGLVEAKSLDGDMEAHTVNGNVSVSTAGAAQGETVNGSIIASVGRICGPLKFSTVNGGITLEMPRSAGAKVRADTVNGAINADFRLPGRNQFGKHVAGIIGQGGPELRIATVNGSINLKRRL